MTVIWNDIEILRIVDEAAQGERSGVFNGRDLMAAAAAERDQGATTPADQESFVRELLVLHHAGLLAWLEMSSIGRLQPITPDNPNDYLQNIRDFTLTYDGHNQARGRVIQVPLPDPDEDDDRMIASLTLEYVAKSITRQLDQFQIAQLIVEGGISGEHEFPEHDGSFADRLLFYFLTLSQGTSGIAASFDSSLERGWMTGSTLAHPTRSASGPKRCSRDKVGS